MTWRRRWRPGAASLCCCGGRRRPDNSRSLIICQLWPIGNHTRQMIKG